MGQQLAIIVMVDIANALKSRTLDDNVYFFDNMKFQGSTGQGTGDLVTAVRGGYWSDGSQGTEQVLNWLPASLGSIPPTVPKSYQHDRSAESDRQALNELASLTSDAGNTSDAAAGLNRAGRHVGHRTRSASPGSRLGRDKVLDVTGNVITGDPKGAHNYPAPVITDVSGRAVDEKIIYPAEYGSPDMVSDGWYWSATIDTSRAGRYAYTLHIQLHELAERNGAYVWEPVDFTCESALDITSDPMRNAFTGQGVGLLPIPLVPAPSAATAAGGTDAR